MHIQILTEADANNTELLLFTVRLSEKMTFTFHTVTVGSSLLVAHSVAGFYLVWFVH